MSSFKDFLPLFCVNNEERIEEIIFMCLCVCVSGGVSVQGHLGVYEPEADIGSPLSLSPESFSSETGSLLESRAQRFR